MRIGGKPRRQVKGKGASWLKLEKAYLTKHERAISGGIERIGKRLCRWLPGPVRVLVTESHRRGGAGEHHHRHSGILGHRARHNPINAYTMGGIVKDAGLTADEFKKLL